MWGLIERTTVLHDPQFDQRPEDGYNTRLQVRLRDGAEREAFVEHPRGGISQPLSNGEIREKFHALTADVVTRDHSRALEAAVLGLEEMDDAGVLADLLGTPVTSMSTPPGETAP